MRIVLLVSSAIGGAVLLTVGAAATKWYVWDVAIEQAGEADRSMLFWGVPILFIGILAMAGGVGLIGVTIHGFRARP